MNRADRRTGLLLVGLAVLAMGWALGNGLAYDAARILHGDARFAIPIDWSGLITQSYWPNALYRPATLLLLGAQQHLSTSTGPVVFHLVSLLLYLGVVLLLARGLRRLGAGPVATLLAAAVFAVHPIHVEVVASVVGQAELLVAIAMLVAILTWHHAALHGARSRHLLLLVACTALGALAKEQGFLLPVILLGQQLLLPRALPRHIAIRWLLVLAAVSLGLWGLHWEVTGSAGGEIPAAVFAGRTWGQRAVIALATVPEAFRLVAFPLHLQADYGPPQLAAAATIGWRPLLGLALLGIALASIWATRRTRPLTSFGLWLAGVTWLPVSSLVVPAGLLLGERVLFLPSLGLALALGGWWIGNQTPHRVTLLAWGAVVVLCTVRSAIRCRAWHDQDMFFTTLVHDAPRVSHAWFLRGAWLRSVGRVAEAEASQQRAIALWPGDPAAHEELGQMLRREGRCAEAIPVMRQGLDVEPGRTPLRAKLGECLLVVGDSAAARALAREAIARGDSAFTNLLHRATGVE